MLKQQKDIGNEKSYLRSHITSGIINFCGTVDDYLSRHPQLKESATVDIYVKRMAFMMALMDAQQRYNRSDDDFIYQLLSSNGDKYARMGVRKFARDCRIERSIGQSGDLNKEECDLIIKADKQK